MDEAIAVDRFGATWVNKSTKKSFIIYKIFLKLLLNILLEIAFLSLEIVIRQIIGSLMVSLHFSCQTFSCIILRINES